MRRLLPIAVQILLQLSLHQCCFATASQQCQSDVPFETVLQEAKIPACVPDKASSSSRDCTVMSQLRRMADKERKDPEIFIKRATAAVFLSSDLTSELHAAWNTSLEVQLTKHLAFVGSMNCSDGHAATLCAKLRTSCPRSNHQHHHIFLVGGYCSETVTCETIGTHMGADGKPSLLPDLFSYVAFRLLERQLVIAKELDEIQVATSADSEYLIQKEIQEAHESQLLQHGVPVAMFVTWPVKSAAYYHIFSMFLDAALTLKELFSFHVITARISSIEKQSSRPFYRFELQDHQASLSLYTRGICRSRAEWPFGCKPRMIPADSLLAAQQFSGFLLHETLKELGIQPDAPAASLPFPAFEQPNKFLRALLTSSDSYIMAVVASDAGLTDPLLDWERLKDLSIYASALLSLTFYPVAVTKPVAVVLLAELNTGIELADRCETMCFIIRLPGAGYELMGADEPMQKLETVAQDAASQSKWYQDNVRLSLDYIDKFSRAELPHRLTCRGHFGGNCNVGSDSPADEGVEPVPERSSVVDRRIDAFVEQSKFSEIYNVTGVLVVESSKTLLKSFLNDVGEDKPWLVLFTVPWSPVCKAARAVWSSVGQCVKQVGLHDSQLAKVDCFEANELCKYLQIDTYPTVAMFKRGGKVNTYTGPITHGHLCAYASLALVPLFLPSWSPQETRDLTAKFLPLTSRVFVLRGSRIPDSVLTLATEMRFKEAFIFEQLPKADVMGEEFSGVYDDSHPTARRFEGDINDADSLEKFILAGHFDVIFPCTWIYLAQALKSARPLIVLFHMTSMTEHMTLLQQLHTKFSTRGASVCHLQVKRLTHLDSLVQSIAGHSLPALVLLPGNRTATYRLPLGPIPKDTLASEATNWVEKGLNGELSSAGQPVDNPMTWEPAGRVYNFVDQVYHGKESPQDERPDDRTAHGGRPFAVDEADGGNDSPEAATSSTPDAETAFSEARDDTTKLPNLPDVTASSMTDAESHHEEL